MTKEEKKQYNKEYYEANKDKSKNNMKEYREDNKDKIRVQKKEYREANKDKSKNNMKEYREANKDKIRAQKKAYQEANKDKRNKWYVNFYNNDPLFKLTVKVRSLITTSLKRRNYKKASRTAEILGCSFEEFKAHIEEQFPRDMTWDNSHLWHYDHIIPLASATSEEELLGLNHYTNFQPLWEEDNREKAAKLDWVKCPIKYAK
jgi:hypothetical protein